MRYAAALIALSLTLTSEAAPKTGITLGIVEPLGEKEALTREDVGTANYKRHMRLAFRQLQFRWRPYPRTTNLNAALDAIPASLSWKLCYQGKGLSRFSTKRPPFIKIAALISTHTIPPDAVIPQVEPPSKAFSGWHGELAERPLVATTGDLCDDPDLWRVDPAAKADLPALLRLLRAEIRKPGWSQLPENVSEPESYSFEDKSARVLEIVDAKRDHRRLVTLGIRDKLLKDHLETFFIDTAGKAKYVGASLRFVDAGDYDFSGRSQVVLRMMGFNRDGYVLLSPDGERLADFHWSYR